jgi:hypothetical protein
MRGRNGADPVSRSLSLANDDNVDVVSEPSDPFTDALSSTLLRLFPEATVGGLEDATWSSSVCSSATARR